MKVRLTDDAKARLRYIHAYIAEDAPQNADRMLARLLERAESLNALHLRGRRVPEYPHDHIREIPERPYRIIYRVTADEIQVLTVLHDRQRLPDDLEALREDD